MKNIAIAIAALTMTIAAPAFATTVVDQSQTAGTGAWQRMNIQGLTYSQSFVAGYDNSVGAGVFVTTFPGADTTGDVTVSLYTAPQGSAGATLLASGTATGTTSNWADVSWGQVALTKGQTYYLGLRSSTSLYVAYSSGDLYKAGSVFSDGNYNYGNGYDLRFRTFANDGAGAVPEPASWAMMLVGIGAMGFAMRRRGKTTTRVAFAA